MKTKQHTLIGLGLVSVSMLNAAIGISGSSLNNATGLADGQIGVYVISDGTAFDSVSITAGDDIFASATYGAGFTVLGSAMAQTGFGSTTLASGFGTDFSFASDIFAVYVYDASTTVAIASDTFNIWTDASWALPSADGVTAEFKASPTGTEIQQLNGASSFSGSVSAVPEPSTFAALAGLCALGAVAIRRRRA